MIGVGAAMSVLGFISPQGSFVIGVNLLILVPSLLLIDNLLYWTSPWLPHGVVQNLTAEAKNKFRIHHWEDEDMPMVVRENGVSFYKPLSVTKKKDGKYYFDELGYRNPPGYILGGSPEVVLLGDSYTEGYTLTPIAEFLRKDLAPLRVYSLGIAGQGPQHWKLQFDRYVRSAYFKTDPRIIIINLYSGNDVSDVFTCRPGTDHTTDASVKPDWPKRKFSFFSEILSILRRFMYLQKTEAVFWQTEPLREDASKPEVAQAISDSIATLRVQAPSAVILLATIPTSDAIYGPDVDRCVKAFRSLHTKGDFRGGCEVAATRQAENSEVFRKLAESLGVEYFDPTPQLRAAAQNALLHGENLHFNDLGNQIYAREVTKKLKAMGSIPRLTPRDLAPGTIKE